MSITLESRLGNLIHEIKEIKKELILDKAKTTPRLQNKIAAWESLGEQISSKWDNISAVEEIAHQREKV